MAWSDASGEIFGYGEITSQYFERYRLPVMHTETNFNQGPRGDEAVHWLWKQWANILQARFHRVPIVGFTPGLFFDRSNGLGHCVARKE